ncbi:hypothetical protein [Tenacibaculum xiamenense]|uniref:hypothetical protein n=1 Tax=Tenacibaculum xiamenense TaxID=1261553 RepID=UPI003894EAA6
MQPEMRKVLNVHKLKLCAVLSCFIVLCSVAKKSNIVTKDYIVNRYKTNKAAPVMTIDTYSDRNYKTEIPSFVCINDIFFFVENEDDRIKSISVSPKPNKKFNIEIMSVGRLPLKLNSLLVKTNDSIVIKAYLKEDNRLIH